MFDKPEDNKFDASFKANAGVKDIVGRGLIYDDNIALIELVKNSKDADSPDVKIEFKNISSTDKYAVSELVISDYGLGMTESEILDKWLNIAFSEKKGMYSTGKVYAGNKGVGRFSCDRLGKVLMLYTKSIHGDYIKLPIYWEDFENKGSEDEISTIKLKGERLDKEVFLKEIKHADFTHGTVLKILDLRSMWDAQKLKKLISELEKFSPSLDDDFEVSVFSDTDYGDETLKAKLNQKVDNGILDKLAFQTTYIQSEIDEKGEYILTSLFFQGKELYSYKAKNPYKTLKNIKVEIHYLDTISKMYFTKNIGIKSNNYGSVFLFYNGFRISPYGNEKNDWLGLDQRKSQGTSRNLGTRDIFGRIDVLDTQDAFSVITSREGLAHNAAFYDLVAYDPKSRTEIKNGKMDYGYVTMVIRQLENFVVTGLDWNRLSDSLGKLNSISADDAKKDHSRFVLKQLSKEVVGTVCEKILKAHLDVEGFEINYDLISKIQRVNEDKYEKFIGDFVEKTKSKALIDLNPREKGTVKRIVESERAGKQAAIEERNIAEKKEQITKQKLDIEKQQRLYLLATRRTLSKDADGLIHTMKINNIEIKEGIDVLIDGISNGDFSERELITRLGAIKLHALKTLKVAELATRSSFDRDIEIRSVNIAKFINEYIGIYKSTFGDDGVEFEFISNNANLVRSISVLNLSIVIDNLISNSVKWGAKRIRCEFNKTESEVLEMIFSDDGHGLSEGFLDCSDLIFDLGVRDEPPEEFGGSGIGLYFSRQLLSEMNAEISFEGNAIGLQGATFKVTFKG